MKYVTLKFKCKVYIDEFYEVISYRDSSLIANKVQYFQCSFVQIKQESISL